MKTKPINRLVKLAFFVYLFYEPFLSFSSFSSSFSLFLWLCCPSSQNLGHSRDNQNNASVVIRLWNQVKVIIVISIIVNTSRPNSQHIPEIRKRNLPLQLPLRPLLLLLRLRSLFPLSQNFWPNLNQLLQKVLSFFKKIPFLFLIFSFSLNKRGTSRISLNHLSILRRRKWNRSFHLHWKEWMKKRRKIMGFRPIHASEVWYWKALPPTRPLWSIATKMRLTRWNSRTQSTAVILTESVNINTAPCQPLKEEW